MNKNEQKKKVTYAIDPKWSVIRIYVDKGSSDEEKAYAINDIFNNLFLNYIRRVKSFLFVTNEEKELISFLYKFRPVFNGETMDKYGSYDKNHSILSRLILDYPKVENESLVVSQLRDNYKSIIDFSKNDSEEELIITNNFEHYNEMNKPTLKHMLISMLRHVLISDLSLPANIDTGSIRVSKEKNDSCYIITKIKKEEGEENI